MIKRLEKYSGSIVIIVCVIAYTAALYNFFLLNLISPGGSTSQEIGFAYMFTYFFTQFLGLIVITKIRFFTDNNFSLSIKNFIDQQKVIKYYIPTLLVIVLIVPLLVFKNQLESINIVSYIMVVHYNLLAIAVSVIIIKIILYHRKFNIFKFYIETFYISLNWQVFSYTNNIYAVMPLVAINLSIIIFGIRSYYTFQKDIQIVEQEEQIYVSFINRSKLTSALNKMTKADNKKVLYILKYGELINEQGKEYIIINDLKIQLIITDEPKMNPYSFVYSILSGA